MKRIAIVLALGLVTAGCVEKTPTPGNTVAGNTTDVENPRYDDGTYK